MDLRRDGRISLRWVEGYLSTVTERVEERLSAYIAGFVELDIGRKEPCYLRSPISLRRRKDHLRVRTVSEA